MQHRPCPCSSDRAGHGSYRNAVGQVAGLAAGLYVSRRDRPWRHGCDLPRSRTCLRSRRGRQGPPGPPRYRWVRHPAVPGRGTNQRSSPASWYPGRPSSRLMAVRGHLSDCLARLDRCEAEPELVRPCKRILSFHVADRPRDALEVVEIVSTFRSAAQQRARRAELDGVRTEEQRKRHRVQRTLVAAVVGLAVIALVGASVTLLWLRGNRKSNGGTGPRR